MSGFADSTLVLMRDLSEKPIKSVRVEDEVFTIEQAKLVSTKVLAIDSTCANLIQIDFASGRQTVCSLEQNFKLTSISKLRKAKSLSVAYSAAIPIIQEPTKNLHYKMGYLIGSMLGDGCRWVDAKGYLHCRYNVLDKDFAARIHTYAKSLGWNVSLTKFFRAGKAHRPEYRVDITTQHQIEAINEAVNDFYSQYKSANNSYRLGFLSGFLDAEGSVDGYKTYKASRRGGRVKFSQKTDRAAIDCVEEYAVSLGFNCHRYDDSSGMTTISILGGWREHVKFLSLLSPAIARKQRYVSVEGRRQVLTEDAVISIAELKPARVFQLTTEHGFYFANQHLVKGGT